MICLPNIVHHGDVAKVYQPFFETLVFGTLGLNPHVLSHDFTIHPSVSRARDPRRPRYCFRQSVPYCDKSFDGCFLKGNYDDRTVSEC